MEDLVDRATRDVPDGVRKLVQQKQIKARVLKESQEYAERYISHELDPDGSPAPEQFPALNLKGDEQDEFLLVLDFFESIGLKLTPQVIRYESQNPDIAVSRDRLAQKYNLNGSARMPLLVQLVDEHLESQEMSK
jgi:hypothetical protein